MKSDSIWKPVLRRCLQAVLFAWSTAVDDELVARLIAASTEHAAKAADLHAQLESAKAENERLFTDNARLVKLIDCGDWGETRAQTLSRYSCFKTDHSFLIQAAL